MKPATLLPSFLLSGLLALPIAAAAEILVDTDLLTVTVNGQPHDFGGTLLPPERLADGTARFIIAGDLILNAGDTLRGIGSVPAVILVGNDVHLMPADGELPAAAINFSAVSTTPGAGGGSGRDGGAGGTGGEGGRGGQGGDAGRGGSGGLIVAPPGAPVPLSITTPGTNAKSGGSGGAGAAGDAGGRGGAGKPGTPGFGNPLSSVGNPAPRPSAPFSVAAPGDGGSAGPRKAWPPKVFFSNGDLRFLRYGIVSESAFRSTFYTGGDGSNGDSGADEPGPDLAAQPDAFGRPGAGASHLGTDWTLTGGSSGGSGSGGSGGPGGPGGGGGGGGAGGQGEWAEPFPTALVDIAAAAADAGAAYLIETAVDAYLKKKGFAAKLNIFNIPTVDVGASGGRGGSGARGLDGKSGGAGGSGGKSGAGGGALRLEAMGRIVFHGLAEATGGDGLPGADGLPGEAADGLVRLGLPGLAPKDGFGMSSILAAFSDNITDFNDPPAGIGGKGGRGASGGAGGGGYPGGEGGGGSGGTLIFKATTIEGSGEIILRGGSHDHEDPALRGGDGKLFLGTNRVAAGSLLATVLGDAGLTLTTTTAATSTSNVGSRAPNPFIAGSPETPTLPDLEGGAESFGILDGASALLLEALGDTLVSQTPGNAVIGAVRLDSPPPPYDEVYDGHDIILVFNPRTSDLTETRFGVAEQFLSGGVPAPDPALADLTDGLAPYHDHPLTLGGYANDPLFGGTEDQATALLTGYKVFAFMVPEDTAGRGLNFTVSAESGGAPFRLEDEHFVNGEIVFAEFNPDIDVYDAEWVGPATGGPDGNWSDDGNWAISLDGTPQPAIYPNNTAAQAYNVGINFLDATVTQDTVVTIDRLGIGDDNALNILDGQVMVLEKFNVRPNAGVVDNAGTITLNSTGNPTSLRFSGSGMLLTGGGTLSTTPDPNNLIGGIRSGDSLIHDLGHTIVASGGLGGDRLAITNKGEIHVLEDPLFQTLVIDPIGGPDRPTPGFTNEGLIRPAETLSAIRLTDGHFLNSNPTGIDFQRSGSPSNQLIVLDGAAIESTGETLLIDDPAFVMEITGTSAARNLNPSADHRGLLFINDADLRFTDSVITIPSNGSFTRTPPVLGEQVDYDITVRNSALRGAVFDFNDPGDLFTSSSNPLDYENEVLQIIDFFASLEGPQVTLADATIRGNHAFRADIDVIDGYGHAGAYGVFDYLSGGWYRSADHATLLVSAPNLRLEGRIENDGRILFTSPANVPVDRSVSLSGGGAWERDDSIFQPFVFAGANPGETDQLFVGSGQQLAGGAFDSRGLVMENEGLLYKFGAVHDDSVLDGPDTAAALEAIRQPLILTNRGVLHPDGVFGGGTVENAGGTVAFGDANPLLQHVRIRGGEIVHHYFKDQWTPAEILFNDPSFNPVQVFNTEFDGLRISAPNTFDPAAMPINGIAEGNADSFTVSGLFSVDATGSYTSDGGTTIASIPLRLKDVHLATHSLLPASTLEGTLKLDPDVVAYFDGAAFIDEGFRFDFSGGTPGGIAFADGLGGEASEFTLPPGVLLRLGGNLGRDTLPITNEADFLTLPQDPLNPGTLTFDPPGDADSPVGFVNRSTLRAIDEFGVPSILRLDPGHYDNREGEIVVDEYAEIIAARITGGTIREDSSSGGAIVDLSGSVLDGVTLDVSTANGNFTLENSRILASQPGFPIEFTTNAAVIGDLSLGVTPGAYGFLFNNSFPQVADPSIDRVIIESGVRVEVETFSSDPITSLVNEGTLTGSFLYFSTPLIDSDESLDLGTSVPAPDAPLGEVVTLAELGLDEALVIQSTSTIRNSGVIGDGSSEMDIDQAVIDNTGGTINPDTLRVYDSLIRNEGGRIESLDGTLYNTILYGGTLSGFFNVEGQGSGQDFGTESVTTLQDLAFDQCDLENGGAFLFISGIVGGPQSSITNGGEVSVAGSASRLTVGSFDGSIITDPPGGTGSGSTKGGTLSLNAGTLEVVGSFNSGPGSRIIGSGTIDFPGTALVAGTLAPGFSAGAIDFTGDLDLTPDTVLDFEIGGTDPGSGYDQVREAGGSPLELDGTLNLSLLDGFVPSPADTFEILLSNEPITGAFGTRSSGERISVPGQGSFAIYYGASSPFDPNAVVLADFSTTTYSETLFVDAAASGAADGTGWADAFPDPRPALAIAQPGDEIWIANGTYLPDTASPSPDRRRPFVLKSGVGLHGGFTGTETQRSQSDPANTTTVISGAQASPSSIFDDAYELMTGSGLSEFTTIEGIEFTAALEYGLRLTDSSATVRHCRFVANNAISGARGATISGGSPTLEYCDFINNIVGLQFLVGSGHIHGCDFIGNSSGGLALSGAVTVSNSAILNNTGSLEGGGAIINGESPVTFHNCTFTGNSVKGRGGAVHLAGDTASFINCRIAGNHARLTDVFSTQGDGGAIFVEGGTLTLVNTLVSGNKADGKGGAIYAEGGGLDLVNATLTANDAVGSGGAGHFESPGGGSITNSIIWNNRSAGSVTPFPSAFNTTSGITFSHSLVQNIPFAGNGNLDGSIPPSEPLFRLPADPASAPATDGDHTLSHLSPMIDAGDSAANGESADLADQVRHIGTIDLGAYEFRGTNPSPEVYSGTLLVTQLGPGNTPAEVDADLLDPVATPGIRVNDTDTNRADYWLRFPFPDDHGTGVLISSVAETSRNNDGTTSYVTTAVENVGSEWTIATHRAGDGLEYNVNVAFAFFPYDRWLAGRTSNSVDNGPINGFTGSPGLTLGTAVGANVIAFNGGSYTLDLRSVDPTATPANGVLLVNGARNDDNFGLSRANSNGTFSLYVHDNGVQGAAYENDPIAFVYVPLSKVGTNELVAAGRVADVGGLPVTLAGAGEVVIQKLGTGTWFLRVVGHDSDSGTLILSSEGGGSNNVDNYVSHRTLLDGWVIESRDVPGNTLQNGVDGEPMFSFAFFTTERPPSTRFAALFPGLDPAGDENGNGLSNFEEYAAGFDPTLPLATTALQPDFTLDAGGMTLSHTLRAGVEDIDLGYLRSDDLSTFVPMIEGVDFIRTGRDDESTLRDRITIELLIDPSDTPRQFFLREFTESP